MPAPFQTKIILGGIILLILATMVHLFFFADSSSSTPKQTGPIACTAEAKRCPNGSYVGRIPPECDFAPCPTGTPDTGSQHPAPVPSPVPSGNSTSADVSGKFGQTLEAAKISITPQSVVEDSRCPSDVQCVQAGTVRIKAQVTAGTSKTTVTLTLGTPTAVGTNSVTLIGVYPPRKSGVSINQSEYLLTFHVNSQ